MIEVVQLATDYTQYTLNFAVLPFFTLGNNKNI